METITVDDVANYLNRSLDVGQSMAASPIIEQTVGEVEAFLGRSLGALEVTETIDLPPGRFCGKVLLRRSPVLSVATVTVDGSSTATYGVKRDGLRDLDVGVVNSPITLSAWPVLEVTYTGGMSREDYPDVWGRALAISARRVQLFVLDRMPAAGSMAVEGLSKNYMLGLEWAGEFTDADRKAIRSHRRHKSGSRW